MIFLFFVLIILFGVFITSSKRHSIKNDIKLTAGVVYEINILPKSAGSIFLRSRYKVNDGSYELYQSIKYVSNLREKISDLLNKKRIQIAYEAGNPSNAELIITKNQYAYFQLSIPVEFSGIVNAVDSICALGK